jgi:hypothetical protein
MSRSQGECKFKLLAPGDLSKIHMVGIRKNALALLLTSLSVIIVDFAALTIPSLQKTTTSSKLSCP